MQATLEIPEQVLDALGTDLAGAAEEIRLLAQQYGVSPFQLIPAELDMDLESVRRVVPKG